MIFESPHYGPFTNLVGTAGAIIAAGAAIGLGFKKRARWEPSEQDVSQGPQRVGSLVAAVGIVLIWANSHAEQIIGLTHLAIWLLALTVTALVAYGVLNATLIYKVEVAIGSDTLKEQKIIGGFWFASGISENIDTTGVTTQDFLKGTGYKTDAVWPRLSRALAKQTFVVTYLVLTVCGTCALAVASLITGFKTSSPPQPLSETEEHETVCMNVPAVLADYAFYLRYVREGPGGWTSGAPLYKSDLPFEDSGAINQDSTRTRCQTITFTKHYGAQFKPYVSLKDKPLSFEQVSKLLQTAGFDKKYITRDSIPQEQNVWFLLPQYQKIQDYGNPLPGGRPIYNNFIAR